MRTPSQFIRESRALEKQINSIERRGDYPYGEELTKAAREELENLCTRRDLLYAEQRRADELRELAGSVLVAMLSRADIRNIEKVSDLAETAVDLAAQTLKNCDNYEL